MFYVFIKNNNVSNQICFIDLNSLYDKLKNIFSKMLKQNKKKNSLFNKVLEKVKKEEQTKNNIKEEFDDIDEEDLNIKDFDEEVEKKKPVDVNLFIETQNLKYKIEHYKKNEKEFKEKKEECEVKLSAAQEKVYDDIKEGTSLFFTGDAGTGKSYALKEYIRRLKRELEIKYGNDHKYKIFITAATGIAALGIGGMSLHSFSGVGTGQYSADMYLKFFKKNTEILKRWLNIKILIIDEISMISAELFDKLDYIARKIRNSTEPFGGIQLIVCGDFNQLPPVEGNLTFLSNSWSKAIKKSIMFKEIFRQNSDPKFCEILKQIRMDCLTAENNEILENCLYNEVDEAKATYLFSHKIDAENKNRQEINKIKDEEVVFKAYCIGNDDPNEIGAEKWCPAPLTLVLKKGCRVILLKNISYDDGLVNGSAGTIVEISCGYPVVLFDNGIKQIIVPNQYVLKEGEVEKYILFQIPLTLGYAITIHKSQGMTLRNGIIIKLDKCFADGQIYVGLSRSDCLKKVKIIGYNKKKIKTNKNVVKYYSDSNKFIVY